MVVGKIELLGMRFSACHGALEWEKTTPQEFVVDFRADWDVEKAAGSDRLEDTLDYGAVCEVVAAQMAVHSDLLENLCGRICDALEAAFPSLEHFSVSVAKLDPPVCAKTAMARITIER